VGLGFAVPAGIASGTFCPYRGLGLGTPGAPKF
jgi:hypothetical protein